MNRRHSTLPLLVITAALTGSLIACTHIEFFQVSPFTQTSTGSPSDLPDTFQIGGEIVANNDAHLFESNVTFGFATPPVKNISAICVREGSDCDGCTAVSPSESFEFSRPSGLKQVSARANYSDGSESSCSTFSVRVTHLNDPPEPQVAGYGHFYDRVKTDGSGACNPADTDLGNQCLPGGLMIKWNSGFASCDNLTLSDSVSDFDWKCTMEGGNAVFYADYGYDGVDQSIAHLIDFTTNQFKEKALNLTVGSLTRPSISQSWWSDTIQTAPLATSAPQTLSTPNIIYLVKTNQSPFLGYTLAADGIAVIGTEAVELTAGPAIGANFLRNMPTGGTMIEKTMIFVDGADATLIETPYLNGNSNADVGVGLLNTQLSFLGRVTARNTNSTAIGLQNDLLTSVFRAKLNGGGAPGEYGIDTYGSMKLSLNQIQIRETRNGISIRNSMKFGILDYAAANLSTGAGIIIYGTNIGTSASPWENRNGAITNVRLSNMNDAIRLNQSENVVVSGFLINDTVNGISIDGGENHRILQGTIARLSGLGVNLHSTTISQPDGMLFSNIVFASMPTAIHATDDAGTVRKSLFSDIIFGPISNREVNAVGNNTNLQFQNRVLLDGPTARCNIGATSPSNIEGDDNGSGDCTIASPEQVGARLVANSASTVDVSFAGKAALKEMQNLTSSWVGAVFPTFNQALYSNVTDWFTFTSNARAWGQQSGVALPGFPLTSADVRCTSGETCEIFDFGLGIMNVNNVLRRRTASSPSIPGEYNPQTPGDGRDFPHTQPIGTESSISCPSHLLMGFHNGYSFKWTPPQLHPDITPTATLRYSVEILLDGVGNDNGLCEPGERCVYTPNFGYYQGGGAGFGPCDQSGDALYDPTDDEFLVFGHGKDGY